MDYLRPRFRDELNEEGNVAIAGYEWTRYDILEGMIKTDGAKPAFDEWLRNYKYESVQRCTRFLKETQCIDRFKELCARIERESVLPFVGAGMSIPCGFQSWGPFLLSLLADAPHIRPEAETLLSAGRYEEAASLIEETLGVDAFAEEIETKLGDHHTRLDGPVQLLPELFSAGCLTTNFDHVLPKVYKMSNRPFKDQYAGMRLPDGARRVSTDPHCLIRLHGVANERNGRVLTTRDYHGAYTENGLDQILDRIIGSRSLLFMGCSLFADRTHNALCQIKQRSQGANVKHYAFLPLPPGVDRIARRTFLAQAEIHPIYYPADDHDQSLEDLLITILEGGPND